jgi:hypothetical protein
MFTEEEGKEFCPGNDKKTNEKSETVIINFSLYE